MDIYDQAMSSPMEAGRNSVRKQMTYVWTCQFCGQPFETTVYTKRYCSPTHKQYAYRERKRTVDALTVNKNQV